MVHFAKTWVNVKPQAWYYSDIIEVNQTITTTPEQKAPSKRDSPQKIIHSSVNVSEKDLKIMNVERVEHITVKVNIDSTYRGRVGMRIISPTGVISDLATFRVNDASTRGFQNWTFMSVAHWGETGIGEWKVEVLLMIQKVIKLKLISKIGNLEYLVNLLMVIRQKFMI